MPVNNLPKCPMCGTNKGAVERDGICQCGKCRRFYDGTDDGGTYSDRNPAARLERAERYKGKRQ